MLRLPLRCRLWGAALLLIAYTAVGVPPVDAAEGAVSGPVARSQEGDPPPPEDVALPRPKESRGLGKGGELKGHGMIPPLGPDLDEGPAGFFEPKKEDRERIRRFMEKHFPELTREMRMFEQRNPRAFRRRMRELLPRMVGLMHEYEKDEELGQLGIDEERLEIDIRLAVHRYRNATSDEVIKESRDLVARLVAEQFDVHQQRAERTIDNLENRIQRLKRQVERRLRNREDVIARETEMRLNPEEPRGPRPKWGKGR